jgi:DNA-binding transcriptional LysR family regulator
MALDWDKLRIFHAVAQAGSFTHAGETLNLSQSAVSRQVSALEDSLKTLLFHRHARGLALTEQGELLFDTAQDIFGKMAKVQGQLMDSKDLPEGPLTITAPSFIGATLLCPYIKNFVEEYPDIKLNLHLDDRVLNLALREADAAIRLYEPDHQDLIQRQLTKLKFHICASKDYLKAHGTPTSVKNLKNYTLISYPGDVVAPFSNANWLFKTAGVHEDDDSTKTIRINSINSIYHAVQSGAGIASLPEYMIKRDSNLEVILPSITQPSVDMHFVYPEEHKNSKRLGLFRDFLLETLSSHTTSQAAA